MARDLRELLREAAPEVHIAPDLGAIERRVRVRRGARLTSAAVVVIVVAGGVVGVAQQLRPDPAPDFIVNDPDGRPFPAPTAVDTPPGDAEDGPDVSDVADAVPAVELPRPLVASIPELVELDPQTGEVLRTLEGWTGEDWAEVSLAPDGSTVFYDELRTACSTELWRMPLYGGEPAMVGSGMRPAVSPDGTTLAYVGYGECTGDEHRLVLRDLESGSERSWGLDEPVDQQALITTLSWSPDSRTIAVEVTYLPRQDEDGVGPPAGASIHLVDTSQESTSVRASPSVSAGDNTIQWHLPAFRGDRGTLLVVELCCDIGMGGGDPHADAETYTILEVDPRREGDDKVLGSLFETSNRIAHLDADASGDHLLLVEEEREPDGGPGDFVLKRLTDAGPVTLADDGALFADWGPMRPQVSQSLYAHPAPELTPRSVPAGGEVSLSGDDSNPWVCDVIEVTLLDGEREVSRTTMKVGPDGSYAGVLEVPANLEPGTYQVNAGCLNDGKNLTGTPTDLELTVMRA